MERSRKKNYSVTEMMFVVIQLVISHKKREGRVHGRPQESKHRRSPPLPEKSKIYIGAFFSKWGPFFFVGALFRLAPLTKNSVGVHGREQTICGYCNKGNAQIHGASNVMFVHAYITHKLLHSIPYYIIIDVLNEGMLNDINNIFKCCT